MQTPSFRMEPEFIFSKPAIALNNEVFPQPLGPKIHPISDSSRSKFTSVNTLLLSLLFSNTKDKSEIINFLFMA